MAGSEQGNVWTRLDDELSARKTGLNALDRKLERGDPPPAERATDREVDVVTAVLAAGSEKAAAHRLGLSHSTVKHHMANARFKVGAATTAQLVWILAPRLPEPEGTAEAHEQGVGSPPARAAVVMGAATCSCPTPRLTD